jgi:hypothetical protein
MIFNLIEAYHGNGFLVPRINPSLTSHHGKKGANQEMAESDVGGFAQIFRAGWEVKTAHSVFDYIMGTVNLMKSAGKSLAGWSFKYCGTIIGGYPPVLEDIVTEVEKVEAFFNLLFGKFVNVDVTVRRLLLASLLRFYNEVVEHISGEPNGKYLSLNNHPFIHRVQSARIDASVSQETFQMWITEVRMGFYKKNFISLSIKDWKDMPGAAPDTGLLVDSRSLIQVVNEMAHALTGVQRAFNETHENWAAEKRERKDLMATVKGTEKKVDQILDLLKKGNLGLFAPVSCSVAEDGPISECRPVMTFSALWKHEKSNLTPAKCLELWLTGAPLDGFDLEKKNGANNSKNSHDFLKMKKVAAAILSYCASFPGDRPTSDLPQTLPIWEKRVKRLAQAAQDESANDFGHDKESGKDITFSKYLAILDKLGDRNFDSILAKLTDKTNPQGCPQESCLMEYWRSFLLKKNLKCKDRRPEADPADEVGAKKRPKRSGGEEQEGAN